MPHMLLVETSQGSVAAVRFATANAAREWEEAHPEVSAVGCVPVVSRREALSA